MDAGTRTSPASWWRRFSAWARRKGLARLAAIVLSVAAIISGLGTFVVLAMEKNGLARFLIVIDLVLVLLLGVLVARGLVAIWMQHRRGAAGSRLHTRIVTLFGAVAVVPAILVAIFSALFFELYFQRSFSDPVNTAVSESVAVAELYIKEHIQTIRADALAMAADLNRGAAQFVQDKSRFNSVMDTQAALRNLSEAVVIDRSQRVIARSRLSFVMEFDRLPPNVLEEATDGDVVIMTNESDDRVRALVRLDRFYDAFLYVGRFIEPRVMAHLQRMQKAASEYEKLKAESVGIKVKFVLIFIIVALLALLASIWFGLAVATRLVRPVAGMVKTAGRVREGDLTARVPEAGSSDEMGVLARAFNRMTSQLEHQRTELIEANKQLDDRRRFTEAVLSGVTAGVIGLDKDGCIDLPNRSATRLLGIRADRLIGKPLQDAIPEMAPMLTAASTRPDRIAQDQVNVSIKGQVRTFLVRVSAESDDTGIQGYVVTFDDITELVSAQRMAAWADVARRIAHEIKNPLTPIQLSAERLRRKYRPEVSSDPDIFERCTETIIRQVGDIGRMVDEFSAFARMPAPVFENEDLVALAEQAVFLQKVAHSEIEYATEFPDNPVEVNCDARQISRVLTNLLQNAAEALSQRDDANASRENGGPERGDETVACAEPGRIEVRLFLRGESVILEIADNGCGLPEENRDRLTEPYVTHREKGTGLGLAIVKKIMEEHGGEFTLRDAPERGAIASIVFPLPPAGSGDPDKEQPRDGPTNVKMVSHGA